MRLTHIYGFGLGVSQQHYDKENKFSYDPVKDADLYSEQLQWIFFTASSFEIAFVATI